MFTISAFIRKNTPELRKRLEELGHLISEIFYGDYLVAYTNGYVSSQDFTPKGNDDGCFIDCGDNDELFLALASLRDDSDYMQLFTDGKNWFYCDEDKFHIPLLMRMSGMFDNIHKATPSELIEHFKK